MQLKKEAVETLRKRGWDNTKIDEATEDELRQELAPIYFEEPFELPTDPRKPYGNLVDEQIAKILEKTHQPLTLVEAIEFDEYTLSGTAENTLNIGNYSSAKRGVFVGRKLRVPRDLPEAQRYELLKTETKKLQFLAEAQLSGICQEAMGPSGFNDTSWHAVVSKIFIRATARVKELFETKVEGKE